MSSCPPSCALRIFQAAKESESSLLFTANLHPAEVWFLMLMCSNTLLHLLYSNATVALCAALCHLLVNPLLLHQLPWGCSACNNTATKTDGLANSLQARWKAFPHSVKLEKNGSQAVLLLRACFCTMFPFTSVQKWWESRWKTARCEPVDEAGQSLQVRYENLFFFFPFGLWQPRLSDNSLIYIHRSLFSTP